MDRTFENCLKFLKNENCLQHLVLNIALFLLVYFTFRNMLSGTNASSLNNTFTCNLLELNMYISKLVLRGFSIYVKDVACVRNRFI